MDRMREKSEVELTGFSARLCVLPNLSETSLRSSIRRLLKCAGFESSSRSNALQGVSWHPARQPRLAAFIAYSSASVRRTHALSMFCGSTGTGVLRGACINTDRSTAHASPTNGGDR